jgi:predicted nucleic acid-binding protein
MSTLLDTNLLLRSTQPTHPLRQIASDAVAVLRSSGEDLCLVPQNLYEYWVVCTRPTAQNGLGMTAAEAEAEIANHQSLFSIFDDTPAVRREWLRLVTQYQVLGKCAHDARLVAAMLVHGIGRLLTFNTQDFQRYPGIVVSSPQQTLHASLPPTAGTSRPVP